MCRRVLAVPISARGRTVRCRFCATSIRIPEKKEAPAPKVEAEPGAQQPEADKKRKAG
jgi:hypothetical protein